MTTILGIETSCDETAAAIVADAVIVRSNVVSSQVDHTKYGGVVPELAARRHVEALSWVVDTALSEAEARWEDIEGIGVTRGPGLVGALLAGWSYGRGVARPKGTPKRPPRHAMTRSGRAASLVASPGAGG